MNVISDTAEYALRAAVWLAQEAQAGHTTQEIAQEAQAGHTTQEIALVVQGGRTTQEIAQATQSPPDYLAKVLKQLARAWVLESRRGAGGGFRIARPAAKISVLEIVNAVDPLERIHTCPLNRPEHCENLCPLHRRIDNALRHVEEAFAGESLADLLS